MIQVREAKDRGHADHGWLNTFHTFSFNTYYDERFMGFRALRVINEDRVAPGQGFGTHPHKDMEIISYVLEGALTHKDSMGTGSTIRPGDVQRMSAGSGVLHSEYNGSETEPVHFLQIWIIPDQQGVKPSYEQKTFSRDDKLGRLRLIASPDGREGSLTIHSDTRVYAAVLESAQALVVPINTGRHLWVQVVRGAVTINDLRYVAGDGAAINDEKEIRIAGADEAEFLVFDLA